MSGTSTHPFVEYDDCLVSATNTTYKGPNQAVSVKYRGASHNVMRFGGKGSFGKNVSRAYSLLKGSQADAAITLRATPIATAVASIGRVLG